MGRKSRMKFAVIIALILTAAIIYSFSISNFQGAPHVGLAEVEPSPSVGQSDPPPVGGAVLIEVTPDTVQNVIRTLSRYTSYRRTVKAEYLRGEEVIGSLSAAVAVDGGWTRCDVTEQNGRTEHTIVGDGIRWLWYNNSEDYVELTAGPGSADLVQRLPTYEDVLALDRDSITAAAYEMRNEQSCIYVEVLEEEINYQERFWVSIESGLLVASETVKDGEMVYRMSSYEVESPLYNTEGSFMFPDGTSYEINDPRPAAEDLFTLPDGTVLHRPAG